MRAILVIPTVCLLLSACADNVLDSDNGGWLVTKHVGETDYELGSAVLFRPDSTEISSQGYDLIASVASDARKDAAARIEVQGFTDTSGNRDHNLALSQARAERVADIMVHQGVKATRIVARGYGEANPAIPTADGVNEPRNRRVVIRMRNS